MTTEPEVHIYGGRKKIVRNLSESQTHEFWELIQIVSNLLVTNLEVHDEMIVIIGTTKFAYNSKDSFAWVWARLEHLNRCRNPEKYTGLIAAGVSC